MKKIYKTDKGFTMVELMIATAIFSVVLLITSAGVIAIGKAYYKSLTTTRVHEASRSVMEDVSRSLQFSDSEELSSHVADNNGIPYPVKARCFGSDRYTYVINQPVNGGNHALYLDKRADGDSCDPNTAFTGGSELLGNNMRLLRFDVSDSDPFGISIGIAYGDDDLLTPYNDDGSPVNAAGVTEGDAAGAQCKGVAGSQFCATSGLETTVTTRVKYYKRY